MQQMLESSDSRIDPLDFSASIFFHAEYIRRFLKSPNHEAYVFAAGEAGSLWSWRHAEVLFHRLKTRYPDFRRYAEGLTCSSSTEALIRTITREFDQREHNLFIPANIDENMIDENGFFQGDGITVRGDALTRHSYHYQNDGSIAEAVSFLALVELWRQEPIVRQLYRKTSNEVTVPIRIRNTNEFMTDGYLHYDLGEATAEDELIQKIRLHFGYGSRATPVARASQNEVFREGVVASAAFWDGHNQEMRSRVCDALRDGRPGNLQTSQDGSKVVATWDTPGYDAASVTGYQILRSVNGSTPEVHVADTSTTDTTWTDENPPEGDLVYEVKAIYDGYYLGPASIRPNIGATGAPSIVGTAQAGSTLVADTSGVGDADGLTEVSYSYQWLADDADIVEATVASYTLTHSERDKASKVRVSFTDDRGNEEALTSAATDPVAPYPSSPATGEPDISGEPNPGITLASHTGNITDANGLDDVSYSYQWLADGAPIADAAGPRYTVVSEDEGKSITVQVAFADDAGNEETLTSQPANPAPPG